MGEDCGTWVPKLHFDWQSPNSNPFGAPLEFGKQNGTSAAMNLGANMASRNEAMPNFVSSALPNSQLGHYSSEPHGWFYCLPRFRQGFTMPAQNLTAAEKPPAGHVKGSSAEIEIAPNRESGFSQKQFLVIDQTGDQTTLVFGSRFGNPVECLASWDSKLHGCNNLNNGNELLSLRRDVNCGVGFGQTLDDKVIDENQGMDDVESEMHEDTEEINALLYSDSDGYSTEDDEVTSTGHSPSTMTTHEDCHEEPDMGTTAEEVGNSLGGDTRKGRLLDRVAYDEDEDDMRFMDTASSVNGKRQRPFEDAESRCSSGGNYTRGSGELGSLPGYKKIRKEKIQDVLSILQCIVPGGKDKDPIELLDEAIRCLKSLKLKAIELGLNAL